MLSTKKAKMSLNKRRERKKIWSKRITCCYAKIYTGSKSAGNRTASGTYIRRMDGFKASSMAGWIPISKVFVSVTTVKIYRLKSKPSQWVSGGEYSQVRACMSWGDSELNFKADYVLKSSLGRIKIIMPSQFPRNVQKKQRWTFF